MAIKGLSRFVVCEGYSYDQPTDKISYTGEAAATEKAVSYSMDLTVADNADLYGDNGIAETDGGQFVSAELTIGTTELTDETSKKLLSVKEVTQTSGEKQVKGLAYERHTNGNVVGVGLIEEHQHHNKDFYRAVIMPRVRFAVPSSSATTRGDSIDWQTPEITGTVMTAETIADGPDGEAASEQWKETYDLETESEALALITAWFAERKAAAGA